MLSPSNSDLDVQEYLAVQRFLFTEASLLDNRDYRGWLDLLTDDVTYRVMAQVNRDATSGSLPYAIIDENATRLKARVEQISNPKLTHAENPPTLTRRFVSNVIATRNENSREFTVMSNILIHRTRPDLPDGSVYAGGRRDVLRVEIGALRIARRDVLLDQTILSSGVSTLF